MHCTLDNQVEVFCGFKRQFGKTVSAELAAEREDLENNRPVFLEGECCRGGAVERDKAVVGQCGNKDEETGIGYSQRGGGRTGIRRMRTWKRARRRGRLRAQVDVEAQEVLYEVCDSGYVGLGGV